jgi:hypothetical protein
MGKPGRSDEGDKGGVAVSEISVTSALSHLIDPIDR